MTRLLILSCSQRKRPDPGLLPAIERYDGPAFRVLRKFQKTKSQLPHTLILSARYGLIPADQPIPDYDERMTMHRAIVLQPTVRSSLPRLIGTNRIERALLCGGKSYLNAFGNTQAYPFNFPVKIASGSIGGQISMLRRWLYEEALVSQSEIPINRPVIFTHRELNL